MAKTRSPGYPAIGLKEAIEKARLVYNKDYQNRLPKKVVAEHMGYKSLNGASLTVLAALGKFGLLEGRGDQTQVSDRALAIIAHEPGAPDRVKAIKDAAEEPALFAELDEKFSGGKASDPAIRAYLLTQKFIPEAADTAIRAYRETKQLVEDESRGYSNGEMAPETPPPSQPPRDSSRQGVFVIPPAALAPKGEPEPFRILLTLNQGVVVSGTLHDTADATAAIKMLEMAKALLPERQPEAPRPAPTEKSHSENLTE